MKLFKLLVLISFFLAFTTTFVHAEDQEVVTDVSGNELHSGARYYMEFASDTLPSAVGPDSPSCPIGYVALDYSKRRPIIITPVESDSTVILEDTYVTVRFNYSYSCRSLISLVWQVRPDGYLTTGGAEDLHRFKLTKYEGEGGSNKYQLVGCPETGSWSLYGCETVGYAAENGINYLVTRGISNINKLPIEFVPAYEEARIAYKLPTM